MSRINAAPARPTLVEAALRFPGSRESRREFNSTAWAAGDDVFKKYWDDFCSTSAHAPNSFAIVPAQSEQAGRNDGLEMRGLHFQR